VLSDRQINTTIRGEIPMLFSKPLNRCYTKTPNAYFEEIVCLKSTTGNEIKLMSHLIRNTLGYNHGAAWMNVTRSKLQNAGISYGSINPTIQSCIKKGWILEFKSGEKGKEVRYLFLCTPFNEKLVQRLAKGELTVANLGSLIHMDVEDVGIQYGFKSTAEPSFSVASSNSKHEYASSTNIGQATCPMANWS
jgi:hypothetical protein